MTSANERPQLGTEAALEAAERHPHSTPLDQLDVGRRAREGPTRSCDSRRPEWQSVRCCFGRATPRECCRAGDAVESLHGRESPPAMPLTWPRSLLVRQLGDERAAAALTRPPLDLEVLDHDDRHDERAVPTTRRRRRSPGAAAGAPRLMAIPFNEA
jgi:hypothetical protein